MKLYLMRHCAVPIPPGIPKPADTPLDPVGVKQAHVMRKFLKRAGVNPDVIISSDFTRAEETALIMQRKDTPLKTTPWLHPTTGGPQDPTGALNSIAALAGDAKAVLVVTHGPLIQLILAAVAVNFVDEGWYFEHGAIAYINTHESRFRWMVTPKLGAHIVGEQPKKVENLLKTARESISLAENLMAATKQATIVPLRNQMRAAVSDRWKRQKRRVLKALRKHDLSADATSTRAVLAQVIPFRDPKFAKQHAKVKSAAYSQGAQHAADQLGIDQTTGAVGAVEADPQKPIAAGVVLGLPKPSPTLMASEGSDLEDFLDNTTVDRAADALKDLGDTLSAKDVIAAIGKMFDEFSDPTGDKLSRADTVAMHAVSDGYHAGSNSTAQAAADAGQQVEKQWDIGDDGCEICTANADEGWIDNDEPHGSGDFEPPAHPNCDCSESYRIAEEE
jgi:phosphohistidine phosphatase SixA